MTTEQQPIKRRRGCLFYGCLTSCILVLVVLAGLILGYLKILNSFTDTKPTALPTVDMSDADMQQVRQRVDTFRNDVRSAHATQPLSLSANEINALIATDPNLKALKAKSTSTSKTARSKDKSACLPLTSVSAFSSTAT